MRVAKINQLRCCIAYICLDPSLESECRFLWIAVWTLDREAFLSYKVLEADGRTPLVTESLCKQGEFDQE